MHKSSRSFLVEVSDRSLYVVKFAGNPLQRRLLVNEWLACRFLNYLGISVPETNFITVPPEFLADYPDLRLSMNSGGSSVLPGIHLGSRLAVRPENVAIFDFLPEKFLAAVCNRSHFLGVLVFDLWSGKTDPRRCVFFRTRNCPETLISDKSSKGRPMMAQAIDHGRAFGGSEWTLQETDQCLYFRDSVYGSVRSLDSFQPWLGQVENFPEEVMLSALARIPEEWLSGDESELDLLLNSLVSRRTAIEQLLGGLLLRRPGVFPSWR